MICGNCCSPAVNILPAYTLDSASVSTVVYLAVELYSNLERCEPCVWHLLKRECHACFSVDCNKVV